MRKSVKVTLEVDDAIAAYSAITGDPLQFSIRLREILSGRRSLGDMWELETIFGVRTIKIETNEDVP